MITEQIKGLIKTAAVMEEIGVVILEKTSKAKEQEIKSAIMAAGFNLGLDYLEIMSALEQTRPIFYIEEGKVLDSLVWEIVREYKGGLVSLMDRRMHTGLKTIKFNPSKSQFIILLTRKQLEAGPGDFFDYVGPLVSI